MTGADGWLENFIYLLAALGMGALILWLFSRILAKGKEADEIMERHLEQMMRRDRRPKEHKP